MAAKLFILENLKFHTEALPSMYFNFLCFIQEYFRVCWFLLKAVKFCDTKKGLLHFNDIFQTDFYFYNQQLINGLENIKCCIENHLEKYKHFS